MCMRAGIRAYLREEATPSKILGYELVPTRASALGQCFLLPHTGGGGNTGPARSRASGQATNIGTIPKNMPTNFQLKRLKLELDIVEKPENRVHKLTDSNVSPSYPEQNP